MKENHESDKSGNNASPAFPLSRITGGSAPHATTYEVLFCHGAEHGEAVISSTGSRGAKEMQYWG
jgi:hypothetical protein